MRKLLLISALLLCCCLNLLAQKGRTFMVEKLSAPKTKVFPAISYQQILENLIVEDRKLPHDPLPVNLSGKPNIIIKSNIPGTLVSHGFHSFFEGMYAAYADHHPFTLSPDMMWLLISQGFANHVNNNVEQLRDKFTRFDRKQTLSIEGDDDMLNPGHDWSKAFTGFSKQIAGFAGPKFTRTMTADFTTTTSATKIASQITLMNAVQSYYNYELIIRTCGIPEITLEGTTKDWERVLAKTELLRQYELDWWVDEMEPVLKQFIQASKGKINKQFWMNMFQHHVNQPGCGPKQDIVDGWIVKFFPYNKKGDRLELKQMHLGDVMPNEVLKVELDCKLISPDGTARHVPLELWAGFVGLEQDSKTYGLKPKIGWMIRRRDPLRLPLVNRLSTLNRNGAVKLHVDNVPPELFQIGPVANLRIDFFGNIRIPDEMADMKVADLTLLGKTTQPDIDHIVKLFPNTKLHINGKDYN